MKMEFTVNGRKRAVETEPLARLLDLLRGDLKLTGCKEGCGEGECGVCAIIMNGRLVNACMIPAMQAAGAELLTIEGLGDENAPDLLQRAFVEQGAVHCGFCTPGMVLAARALLEETPEPSPPETKVALSGNLCRCTGYARIYAAVDAAVQGGYRPAPSGPGERLKPEYSAAEKDRFFSPDTLDEALDILAAHPGLTLLAGGTDTGPDMKSGKLRPSGAMDLFRLAELKKLEVRGNELIIGPCVTDAEMMENAALREKLPALREAAAQCAAPAVRNRASIGGNLCSASGAADLPVALMALGASVLVKSKNGERNMPVTEFIKGYRQPDLKPGELLAEIRVPLPPAGRAQQFYKRGSRAALTLSRVSVAVYAEIEDGRIKECRGAAGSMSPVPVRLPKLEHALRGQKLDARLIEQAVEAARGELNPRKSPKYRKAIAGNLVRRFLEGLLF